RHQYVLIATRWGDAYTYIVIIRPSRTIVGYFRRSSKHKQGSLSAAVKHRYGHCGQGSLRPLRRWGCFPCRRGGSMIEIRHKETHEVIYRCDAPTLVGQMLQGVRLA